MGYGGKIVEQERARELRADAWTLREIAAELGVATSSVSRWVRDVEFEPRPRRGARRRGPNALQRRKAAEIADLREEGRRRLAGLTDRELLVAGTALYAGEGDKRGGMVSFVNSDPRMIVFFLDWLRYFFEIDESRLRARLYLHQGLDLDGAVGFWSELTGIRPARFGTPYRAVADGSTRRTKHVMGCLTLRYSCTRTHRAVMGLVSALLDSDPSFRGSSAGRAPHC